MENTVAINTSRQQLSGRDNDSDDALIPDSAGNSLESLRSTRWRNVVTVGILCFINLINYMDRFTLAGILTDVQDHFHKRDDEVGLLQTVFIISYMLFAPVFGYLGDRRSRKILMASGIFLWSLTTLIGSYVDNFWWFMFFRAMVGIGEASYSTIAPTIISDLFVKDVRSKMLALFYFAIPVGSGLGYIVGSETAKLLGGWQWGLRVTPALGAVAVLLMLLVMQDPARGEAEGGSHVAHSSYKEDIKALLKNRSFMFSTAGFTCVAFVAGALAWWGPHFIFLGLKLQPDQTSVTFNDVSLIFGVISMVSGLIGVPLGVSISEALYKRCPRVQPIVCAVGMFLSAPLLLLAIWLIESYTIVPFALVFFGQLALNLNWALVADMLLYVVIPTRRSTAEAFQILISHTFGDAGSPYLIGVISELLKVSLAGFGIVRHYSNSVSTTVLQPHESDRVKFKSLQYALFITTIMEVLGGIFFIITARFIVRDKMRVERVIAESSGIPTTHQYADDILGNVNSIT